MVVIYKCDNCKKDVESGRLLHELRAGNHYYGEFCDYCLEHLKLDFKKGEKDGHRES
jgi:hypothetical protein